MRPSNFSRIPLEQIFKEKVFPMRFAQSSPALEMLRPRGGEPLEHSRTYYFRYSNRPSAIRVYGSKSGAESELESELVYASSISGTRDLMDFFLGLLTPRERGDYLTNAVVSREVGKEGFRTGKDQNLGYQTHHIIPLTLCSKHPLMLAATRYGFFSANASYNAIDLPGDVHSGNHPNYTDRVEADLNRCLDILGEDTSCEALVNRSVNAVLDKWREYCQVQKSCQRRL
jgi:hypothetical protein